MWRCKRDGLMLQVVKNVVVKSVEMKKMVYMYLVHYAVRHMFPDTGGVF